MTIHDYLDYLGLVLIIYDFLSFSWIIHDYS